ncbi:MAG: choice-of-anchor tandem repeat GloVer-containing protein [Bryobacteraceae bacterium]|jgi:uncharacterized repeat protein (TIGR03803 family)
MQSPIHKYAAALSSLAAVFCVASAQPAAAGQATNIGTLTLLTGFGGPYGSPGLLIETSPARFVGIAVADNATAFELSSLGALSTLYSFPANAGPGQTIVQAMNGMIYGSENAGNFSLSAQGAVTTYPAPTGFPPNIAIQLPDGSLYGTSAAGTGHNALLQMTLRGTETVLHSFSAAEGRPFAIPVRAPDGNFYGISAEPAPHSNSSASAIVYRITPQGQLTTIAKYPDGRPDYPAGNFKEYLVLASNGLLYGTAALGGSNKAGAIFQLSLDGNYTQLYEFQDFATGIPTFLTQASDGNLYGVAQGKYQFGGPSSLFRITPAGQFETLQVLNGLEIGTCPCWLTQGSDGLFYGTTMNGGPGSFGTAWKWNLGLPKPLPTLSGTLPDSGAQGAKVVVWGENLLGATGVSFNGTPATTFSNISREYVVALVPTGATTGPVTVTTPNGSATTSGSFTIE